MRTGLGIVSRDNMLVRFSGYNPKHGNGRIVGVLIICELCPLSLGFPAKGTFGAHLHKCDYDMAPELRKANRAAMLRRGRKNTGWTIRELQERI
jgi:hypothetical protein